MLHNDCVNATVAYTFTFGVTYNQNKYNNNETNDLKIPDYIIYNTKNEISSIKLNALLNTQKD